MKNYINLLLLVIIAFAMNLQAATVTTSKVTTQSGDLSLDTLSSGSLINLDSDTIAKKKFTFNGKVVHAAYNDTSTGANVTLENHTSSFVRLTGTPTSIDGIPAGSTGERRLILNLSGGDVTINNDTGATAANRILTGTGSNLKIKANASFQVMYDVTQLRWFVIGGAGGSSSALGDVDTIAVEDFENSSLADFTYTGAAFDSTTPIHGARSMVITHDSSLERNIKKVIALDRKFRGVNITLRIDCRSTASTGNATIQIYDETNNASLTTVDQALTCNTVTPAYVTYVSVTTLSTTASISWKVKGLAQAASPTTTIDDVSMYVTKFSAPTTGYYQELDSYIEATGGSGNAGAVLTFTATQNGKGDAFTWAGSKVTFRKDSGIACFSFSGTLNTTGPITPYFRVNGVTAKVSGSTVNTNTYSSGAASCFYLLNNDYVEVANGSSGNITGGFLSASYQGSLKQVSVNTNSKIKIPVSELRFEGASTRGSTNTSVVRFTGISKLTGDAFDVSYPDGPDSTLGTYVKMKKPGWLCADGNLYLGTAGGYTYLTRNQTTGLTGGSEPTIAAEILKSAGSNIAASSPYLPTAWCGNVAIGDYIRYTASTNPVADSTNHFHLSFFETDIQVSVNNVLPQYSENDLVVKAAGNAGQTITANVTNIPFVTVTDVNGAWNGSQFTVQEDGLLDITGAILYTVANSRGIDLFIDGVSYRRISSNVSTSIHPFSISDSFTKGQVLSIRDSVGGTLSNTSTYHWINITKRGKPNVTGVDVSAFANVPTIDSEALIKGGASVGSTNTSIITMNNTVLQNTTGQIVNYTQSSTLGDSITCLKIKCRVAIKFQTNTVDLSTGALGLYMMKNSTTIGTGTIDYSEHNSTAGSGARGVSINVGGTYDLAYNDVLRIGIGSIAANYKLSGTAFLSVHAWATSANVVSAPESFSTDTAPLTFQSSASYTLTTLPNAPMGSFITYSYTTSTNTRTQCTTAPTQTTSDMNANGIIVYGRAYNAASTCAQPASVALNVGKGFKGYSLFGYKSAGRVTSAMLDFVLGSSAEYGVWTKNYNEATGIMLIDLGLRFSSTTTAVFINYEDNTATSSAYFTFQASKSPTSVLSGPANNRIAVLTEEYASTTAPQNLATTYTARRVNTVRGDYSFIQNSSSFTGAGGTNTTITLDPGTYKVTASAAAYSIAATSTLTHKIRLQNITDGTTTLIGKTGFDLNSSGGQADLSNSDMNGVFTITAAKSFEVQHRGSTAQAAGTGAAASFGDNEVYLNVEIQKIR